MTQKDNIQKLNSNWYDLFDKYGIKSHQSNGNEYETTFDKKLNPIKTGVLTSLIVTPLIAYSLYSNSSNNNKYLDNSQTQQSSSIIQKEYDSKKGLSEFDKKVQSIKEQQQLKENIQKNNLESKLNLSKLKSLGINKVKFNTDYYNNNKVDNFTCLYNKKGSKLNKMVCYNSQTPNDFLSEQEENKLENNLNKPFKLFLNNPEEFKKYMSKYNNIDKDKIASSTLDYNSVIGNIKSVDKLMKLYNGIKKITGLK